MEKPKTETLELSLQQLRQRLDYDPASGVFTRKSNYRAVSLKPNSTGYLRISINGVSFKAHRLAWFYVHGSWPDGDLDHINGDKTDNRLINLRPAKRFENQRNRKRPSHNRSGIKGVYLHTLSSPTNPRWVARIKSDGKQRHLGCFDTIEAAAEAYKKAALKEHGEFAKID